jgi:hypothetical protein
VGREKADFDEAAAKRDDGCGGPGLLHFAGGPEDCKEPLFWLRQYC